MVELTTILILSSLFLFLIGMAGGWLLSREKDDSVKTSLQVVVGVLVTIVWVVSIAAEIVIPAYTVSVLIHGIMGAVVGYLFSEDGLDLSIGNVK